MDRKVNEITIMRSNIFRPGERFFITDKSTDGKFIPGSIGFVSFVKGVDQQFPNVVHLSVVITKKGKNGKERIEVGDLSAPIFDVELTKDNIELPGPDRKFFTHIEHMPIGITNLSDMCVYDFMGWAFSKAKFLHKLSGKVQHIRVWPNSSLINTTMELPMHMSDSISSTKEFFSRTENINELLTLLAKTEAKLARCYVDYMCKTAELELGAARNLLGFYTDKQASKEVLAVLNDTTMFCFIKAARLGELLRVGNGPTLTNKVKADAMEIFNAML